MWDQHLIARFHFRRLCDLPFVMTTFLVGFFCSCHVKSHRGGDGDVQTALVVLMSHWSSYSSFFEINISASL